MKRVWIYDTTLRDGKQAENVNLSLGDMVAIVKKLDQFGVDYVECGWPGANPKDKAFFEEMKKIELAHARVAAFGSTRHAKYSVKDDPNLEALLKAETPVVTIFGKSWDLHVREVFHIPLEENIKLVYESVDYLKSHNKLVFFDAEHFFDGYHSNPEYAIEVIRTAEKAGADAIVLADTNGGMLPVTVREVMAVVMNEIKVHVGIHAHNDSDNAVANSLEAVLMGAVQVQGTINGIGERCGNANLVSIVPNLVLKLGYDCGNITQERLKMLTEVSHYVYEIANILPENKQPYTGQSAFAHKGGVHVNAVEKNPKTYEHIEPAMVGNRRRILISEQSGKSNILEKARELGIDVKDSFVQPLVQRVKEMESMGYEFEGADASFELLVKRLTGHFVDRFEVLSFRVSAYVKTSVYSLIEATVKLRVGEMEELTVGEGDGPVNALDVALKKGLSMFYPVIKAVRLTDYKVRILNPKAGTAAATRVLMSFQYNGHEWQTVGVSENVIEASWQALVDSMHYILMKVEK